MSFFKKTERFVTLFERLAKIHKELLILLLFFLIFSESLGMKLIELINLVGGI